MNDTVGARDRAAAMLGLPPHAEAAIARATFLQRLERIDFVPPPAWCAGLNGLDERAIAGGFAIKYDDDWVDWALRTDLKQFGEDYWKLPPEQRRQRFADLSRRCRDDVWSQRQLMHLQKGLDVESRDFYAVGGLQATIATIIHEVFVLPKIERANERNTHLAGARSLTDWRSAALSFRRNHPRLAALDPELLKRLEDMPSGHELPMPVRRAVPSAPAKKGGYGWLIYLAVIIGIAIIRAAGGSSSSRSNSTYNPPEIKMPTFQQYPYQSTYYSQSPYSRAMPEDASLLAEMNGLVALLRTAPNDAAYQRLKDWLDSPKCATLRLRGHAIEVFRAEKLVADYELKKEFLKRPTSPREFRP